LAERRSAVAGVQRVILKPINEIASRIVCHCTYPLIADRRSVAQGPGDGGRLPLVIAVGPKEIGPNAISALAFEGKGKRNSPPSLLAGIQMPSIYVFVKR